jgi:hypothetical protein
MGMERERDAEDAGGIRRKTTGKRKLRKLWEEIFDHTLYICRDILSILFPFLSSR